MSLTDIAPILLAAFAATASPGPSTLAIAGAAMGQGRGTGFALAFGVTLGSWTWSAAAALGLGGAMAAHGWAVELLRWLGAGYLLWLALRSARGAWRAGAAVAPGAVPGGARAAFLRGLALHLTNPKAILFFGALYSVGTPAGADARDLLSIVVAVGAQSAAVFLGYAALFAAPAPRRLWTRARRRIEAIFAIAFALASLRLMTARLGP
jgi:threonine/homoserine/homoserine lactone efflux protein